MTLISISAQRTTAKTFEIGLLLIIFFSPYKNNRIVNLNES